RNSYAHLATCARRYAHRARRYAHRNTQPQHGAGVTPGSAGRGREIRAIAHAPDRHAACITFDRNRAREAHNPRGDTMRNDEAVRIRGAHRNISARGTVRERWYRMVWRDGRWSYVTSDREPRGTFLAADRRWSGYGDVFPGEIVVEHGRGGPVSDAYVVDPDPEGPLTRVEFARTREGLRVTLPDGSTVDLPDPRAR